MELQTVTPTKLKTLYRSLSLLFEVAKIESTTFEDLAEAIADGREGFANGLIQRINDNLARYLNFPRWWAQDREFRLLTSPREHDLVFTIRDRTGTDYSFAERSNGLKYFLSYHVQLLAHQPPEGEKSEILLMDEPDAYLSNQGQQDLLRILERFARPEDRSRNDQIVYVTHSPFLINRNAGERVRVLDKGVTGRGHTGRKGCCTESLRTATVVSRRFCCGNVVHRWHQSLCRRSRRPSSARWTEFTLDREGHAEDDSAGPKRRHNCTRRVSHERALPRLFGARPRRRPSTVCCASG